MTSNSGVYESKINYGEAGMEQVKERPILFSAPMVMAIIYGSKTQTRRVIPWNIAGNMDTPRGDKDIAAGYPFTEDKYGDAVSVRDISHYGKPGGRLWVRETWKYADWTEDGEPYIQYRSDNTIIIKEHPEDWQDRVAEVWAKLSLPENYQIDNTASDRKWRPSIFMPRWASRITLEITDIRVERLQDISEEDAENEGISFLRYVPDVDETLTAKELFMCLWDAINGKSPGKSWANNPWVWVVEFKRLNKAA